MMDRIAAGSDAARRRDNDRKPGMPIIAEKTARLVSTVGGRVGPKVAAWGRIAVDLLFPARCAHCHGDLTPPEEGILLCPACRSEFAPSEWAGCERCGAAFADGQPTRDCLLCRRRHLYFDGAIVLGRYEGTLRDAVLRMKRLGGEPLASAVGDLLAETREKGLGSLKPDMVVPVPMHWRRRLARGTNSPEVLSERIARKLRIPVLKRALRQVRNTLPQKDLPFKSRWQNVRGAFGLRAGYDLGGARVVLVDDVLTTGATCSEAARVLKYGGASHVVAVVVARAQGTDAS